jgi:hypothetical protein
MALINDWLDDRIQEIINNPGFHAAKADFRDQAKNLVEQAVKVSAWPRSKMPVEAMSNGICSTTRTP